ncbi:MAG: formylmethanofuran dehydrogenase subunit C [Gemmatimonadota bacterium]
MSDAITLTPKSPFKGLISGEALAPDRLAALSGSQLSALLLPVEGQGTVALADLCRIEGDGATTLRCDGDWSAVSGLGSGMASGRLEFTGNSGSDLGVGMQGGVIVVRGDAGANIGGAPAGASKGMTGGEIIVFGRAGANAGCRMRRGMIYVAGAAGTGAGQSMIAGTLVLGAAAGNNLGLWNKRGSIVALGQVAIPVTYGYACSYHPPAVPLLLGRLARLYGAPLTPAQAGGQYRRYSGDLAESGKGEILAWMAA